MDGIIVALQGRIAEPERRYTSNGSELLQFSLLPHDTKADAEHPEWVRVSAFVEKIGEDIADRLTKGCECYVEGRLRMGRWTAQDGSARSGMNVSAWQVTPMGQIGRRRPVSEQPARSAARTDAMPQHLAIPRRSA
jgi:single-strand DNA-binding protein